MIGFHLTHDLQHSMIAHHARVEHMLCNLCLTLVHEPNLNQKNLSIILCYANIKTSLVEQPFIKLIK